MLLRRFVDILWLHRVELLVRQIFHRVREHSCIFQCRSCRLLRAGSLLQIRIFLIVTTLNCKRWNAHRTWSAARLIIGWRWSKDAATPIHCLLSLITWLFERVGDSGVIVLAKETGAVCLLLDMLLPLGWLSTKTTSIKRISNRFWCASEYEIHFLKRIINKYIKIT